MCGKPVWPTLVKSLTTVIINILQALRESQMSCVRLQTNLLQKPIEKTLICSSGFIFDNHPIQNDIYSHYFQWCQTNFKSDWHVLYPYAGFNMKVLHLPLSSTIIVCKTKSICIFKSHWRSWVAQFFLIFFYKMFHPKSTAMWSSLKFFFEDIIKYLSSWKLR